MDANFAPAITEAEREKGEMSLMLSVLKHDRYINIIVGQGNDAETFKLPQAVFEGASPTIAAALWPDDLAHGPGPHTLETLRLPEDDIDVWKAIVVYLQPRRQVPSHQWLDDPAFAIRCCAFAAKHHMFDFHDQAMLTLLHKADVGSVTWEHVKLGLKLSENFLPLAQLMVEEAIRLVYHHRTLAEKELNELNTYGVTDGLLHARSRFERSPDYICHRFESVVFLDKAHWRRFLLDTTGNGITFHRGARLREEWRALEHEASVQERELTAEGSGTAARGRAGPAHRVTKLGSRGGNGGGEKARGKVTKRDV